MEAHPRKTAWVGHYIQFGRKHEVRFDDLVFGYAGEVSGGGEDALGNFELKGEYTSSSVSFSKAYTTGQCVGQGLLLYEGRMYLSSEGMKITGQYSFPSSQMEGDDFEILRSKELEQKRDAAFKSVVATMKVQVGMFRFFTEDFWMHTLKVYDLVLRLHGGILNHWFTILSLFAGVAMNLAGPFLEARVARVMAEASAGITPPSISDGGDRQSKKFKKGRTASDAAHSGYVRLQEAQGKGRDAGYQQMLEDAKEITTAEYFTGNLDYIAALMQSPQPAEVVDVAICDVIVEMPIVGKGLVFTSAAFWIYTLAFPFMFDVPCDKGTPATAHLIYFMTAFFNVFIQIWCASLTKYGYLMLVHAPQMYFFDIGLSFLGFFSSYSSVAWIVQTKSCGSWIWKPAAAVYFIGMIVLQAAPGIYLLSTGKHLPMALRLTQNNLLIALLKPKP